MVVNQDTFFLSHRLLLARAARASGFSVVVIAGETGSGQAIRQEGFDFIPLRIDRSSVNPLTEARTIGFLAGRYRALRPSLIHHSTVKPVIYGSFAARLVSDAAVVNTISGLGYVFTSEHRAARALRPILRRLWRMALQRHGSRTIFQNSDDRGDFIKMGLVREEESILIPGSGVDCARFVVCQEPDDPLVLLPARMLWDKGIQEFVDAARILREMGHRARFALAGDCDPGNRESIPQQRLQQWNDDGAVEWWGYQRDMPSALSRASVVVLPSYGEGLPKTLLEAAAAGRAVVSTDVRGCREAVQDGVNGILVPPRDARALAQALDRLLRSSSLRRSFGEAGRRLAETRFAESVIASQTMAVYEQLVGQHQCAPSVAEHQKATCAF